MIEETPFEEALPGASRTFPLDTAAPWLALAAVGIGVAGIVREVTRRRTPSDPFRARLVADGHEFTPPHGDKLHAQV